MQSKSMACSVCLRNLLERNDTRFLKDKSQSGYSIPICSKCLEENYDVVEGDGDDEVDDNVFTLLNDKSGSKYRKKIKSDEISHDDDNKLLECDHSEHLNTVLVTPQQEEMLENLLKEHDIEDIDPEILETLKLSILATIRLSAPLDVKHEPAEKMPAEKNIFECTGCNKHFASCEEIVIHNCKEKSVKSFLPFRKRGRPPRSKPKKDDVEEYVDSDKDPEWNENMASDDEEEEGVTLYPETELPEYTPRSTPCECEHCGMTFRSKVRLQFHLSYHKPQYSTAEAFIYDCRHCSKILDSEAELFDHIHFEHKNIRSWTCPIKTCKRVFKKRATSMKHMRMHSNVRRFACKDCDKKFKDRQTLIEHSVLHMKVKPFQCHICFKYMTRRSRLRAHLKNHDSELVLNAVYACSHCQMGFVNAKEAEIHGLTFDCCMKDVMVITKEEELDSDEPTEITIIDNNNFNELWKKLNEGTSSLVVKALTMFYELSAKTKTYVKVVIANKALRCEYCESVYLEPEALRKHWQIHANVKNPFICNICSASYPTYARVTTHKSTHGYYCRTSLDIKMEESSFISESLENPQASVPEQRNPDLRKGTKGYFPIIKHFLCNACDKTLLHWTYMQIHKRGRHLTDQYKCPLCQKDFPNSWTLSHHRQKVHNIQPVRRATTQNPNDKVFRCIDCGKKNASKSALHYHRRTAHASHSCTKCILKFGTSTGLETHMMKKHKKGNNRHGFQCTQCDNSYKYSAGLYTHMKRIHEKSLKHTCAVCGLSFFSRYELDSHIRGHTDERPFKCSHCGKAFRNTSLRNSHEKTHLNLRPYPCTKCKSAFKRSSALKNHLLLHTGVKTFGCGICRKTFWNHSTLKFHFKKKHSDNSTKESYLILKVPKVDVEAPDVVKSLLSYNIPKSRVLDMVELKFKKDMELPKTLNLSQIPDFGLVTMVFKPNGEPSLVSAKGNPVATLLKKPIAPAMLDEPLNSTLNAVDNFKETHSQKVAKTVREMRGTFASETTIKKIQIAEEDVAEEETTSKSDHKVKTREITSDKLIVMDNGKIVINGETFQISDSDGQPLNFDNAKISLNEDGQVVIEEAGFNSDEEMKVEVYEEEAGQRQQASNMTKIQMQKSDEEDNT